MVPMLKSWVEQFAIILQPPVDSEDPDDWGIRMEVGVLIFFSISSTL